MPWLPRTRYVHRDHKARAWYGHPSRLALLAARRGNPAAIERLGSPPSRTSRASMGDDYKAALAAQVAEKRRAQELERSSVML